MKSTGEVIALHDDLAASLQKAFIWNESLAIDCSQKNGKELLVLSDSNHLKKAREGTRDARHDGEKDLAPSVGFNEIEAWMKSEVAFAILQPNADGDKRIRERALDFDLFVFTKEETFNAFLQMEKGEQRIKAINEFQLAYEKEVVLQ